MQLKKRISMILIIVAAVLSVFLPAKALFTGDGFFAWQIRQKQTYQMAAELILVFMLLWGSFFYGAGRKIKYFLPAGICLLFCWLHVTFLPMLVSGLYLLLVMLIGRFFRVQLCRTKAVCGYLADFLLGSSIMITQFCLLSALSIGGIPVLKMVAAAEGIMAFLWILLLLQRQETVFENRFKWFQNKEQETENDGFLNRKGHHIRDAVLAALLAFIFTMFLNQIGKMNISLDFDTLWYGVRSEYILNSKNGIYENPGLVGMAYVYSKGWEVLTLPLCDLSSHSYLLFFNIWLTGMGLMTVYQISLYFMKRQGALLAAALTSAIPGIMNMSISAKTDIITWLLQLIMILYLLCYIREKEKKYGFYLMLAAGAYVLSLTMKPTSLVFSTAVFGMAVLYLLFKRMLPYRNLMKNSGLLVFPVAALIGIWGRTVLLTGMPVTSVFTSIFAKLGFKMKYPFATGSLPQNWQDESNLHVLLRRLYQMLLCPEGKDMAHVILAWGTSMVFFLAVCAGVIFMNREQKKKKETDYLSLFAHTLFWPFLAVNLLSLIMLYQVDGNYFILLYTGIILFSCTMITNMKWNHLKNTVQCLLVPIFILNMLVSAESNWAWSFGYSEIKIMNKGRVNHETLQHLDMIEKGNSAIWEILSSDKRNRVIAFGEHPFCLQFPCNVQSYKDITSPWGNAELVESAETFKRYMDYAKTDYVYVEAGYIGETSWSWSYGILTDLIQDGTLTDLFFQNGNLLARVRKQDEEFVSFNMVEENLKNFYKQYETAEDKPKDR